MRQVAFTVNNETQYSFDTWGVLLAHVDFGFPPLKSNYLEVEGVDGVIDMTESLDGMPHYDNREVTAEFRIIHVPYGGYLGLISKIATFLHGKKCEVVFDADKGYKFVGRCTVDYYDRELDFGKFSIRIEAEPFKLSNYTSDSEWIWDTFDFMNGILEQDGSGEVSKDNQTNMHEFEVIGKPVRPILTAICNNANTDAINLQITIRNIDTNEIVTQKPFSIGNTEMTDLLDDDFKANGNLRMTVRFYPMSSGRNDDVITYSFNVKQEGVL